MFRLGDKVRIISSNQIGHICDIVEKDGIQQVIVDCYEYVESSELLDVLQYPDIFDLEKIK